MVCKKCTVSIQYCSFKTDVNGEQKAFTEKSIGKLTDNYYKLSKVEKKLF